jgi:EpsD family peptidyl-prolyl cis-trans isomerase
MKRQLPLALTLGIAALAGCGKSDDTKPASQVAAKVNSYEITIHQVNAALARSPNIAAEAAPSAKRGIVERLIDQQLAKEQAIAKKLDRSPSVVQAMESAKNEILARAYLQDVAAAQPKPTQDEVKKYYAEHPELFSSRRVYLLEEIAVARPEGNGAALRERVAKARSMQEIAEWLKSRDVQYAANRGGRAAEQIPLDMLSKLQGMKDGEIQVMQAGDSLNVIRVAASKAAPLDEASASPRIQQFLFNRRSNEAMVEEMKRLKAQAKIEYVGEFAGAVAPRAKPAVAADAPKDAQEEGNVENGVRGLR